MTHFSKSRECQLLKRLLQTANTHFICAKLDFKIINLHNFFVYNFLRKIAHLYVYRQPKTVSERMTRVRQKQKNSNEKA